MASPSDINLLSTFLAHSQTSLSTLPQVDCIVICASAILNQASTLFQILENRPSLTKTLVLCGGIGHSTPLIYEAVARHPTYHTLGTEVNGLPEAKALQLILERFFDVGRITSEGCMVLVEDKSTNCAANARETKAVLESRGVSAPGSIVVVQDPTMARRTAAAFERVYANSDTAPQVLSCHVIVPRVRSQGGSLQFEVEDVSEDELWEMRRFLDLIMGEIPRLERYGPGGTDDIVEVEVPGDVQEAWERLRGVLETER